MMKLLFVNCCYSSNFGDQAIGQAMQKLAECLECTTKLCDLTEVEDKHQLDAFTNMMRSDCDKKQQNRGAIAIVRGILSRMKFFYNLYRKISAIWKRYVPDVLVIGGGELIQSNNLFAIAIYLWVKRALTSKTKIVFLGWEQRTVSQNWIANCISTP